MQTLRENAFLLFKTPCLWYLLWQPELIKARLLCFPSCLPNPFFMLLYTAMLNHVLTFHSLALTPWWRARLHLLLDVCNFFSCSSTPKRENFSVSLNILASHIVLKQARLSKVNSVFSLGWIDVARAVSEILGRMNVSKQDNSFWVDEMRKLIGMPQYSNRPYRVTRTFSGKPGQIQNLRRCEGGSCAKYISLEAKELKVCAL